MNLEDQIFERHYNYYKNVGIETIKQQAGQVEQVSADYQGRVIFELLQNAFDKAKRNILVQVRDNCLIVANDGEKFTYIAEYNYEKGSAKRGDFQSMCSISTSTKDANTSIGNKGVGFKSAFSIARDGFVNVYTQGQMILDDGQVLYEPISFRIYDSFKDITKIPHQFSPEIISSISEKITLVQQEKRERGVPGYYFPLHFTEEPQEIINLFDKGYVTVIEIPFYDKAAVCELFNEIKGIHFDFVQLKYSKEFEIEFDLEGDLFTKNVNKKKGRFFSAEISNPRILEYAKEAGVSIEYTKVGFLIKDNPDGLLYNYLPTKVKSPFKYIDFHADFHTKVDRTDINFDNNTAIGKYNSALLLACIELYFLTLNSSLNNSGCLFNNYVESINFDLIDFNWHLIDVVNDSSIYEIVKEIFQIEDYIDGYNLYNKQHYKHISYFLSVLAFEYFSKERSVADYKLFYKTIHGFINKLSDDYNKKYSRSEIFKFELCCMIKEKNVKAIPNIFCNNNSEILYKKEGERDFVKIPSFIDINLTSFEIDDQYVKRALGIRDFTDYNELLKYFKQCSFCGEYSEVSILEEQQIDLLKCIYQIYLSKDEKLYLSTHRFTTAYNKDLRKNNSTLNQANFNISTIFLKLKNGKYKPAQICLEEELDKNFLVFVDENLMSNFLRFLGVSLDYEYIYADSRLYKQINDGTDYIPSIIRNELNEDISDEVILNLSVINKRNIIHSSLINNNDFRFLEKILKQNVKEELQNLLVQNYDNFPSVYRMILKERMEKNFSFKKDVIRLYQTIFNLYHHKDKQYLVIKNDQLYWTTDRDFIILNSKQEFELCLDKLNKPILCYYSGFNTLPEELHSNKLVPQKGNVSMLNAIECIDLKQIIDRKIVFLLLKLSESKNTNIDFLDDKTDLTTLQKFVNELKIIEGVDLFQEYIFQDTLINIKCTYAYNEAKDGILYIDATLSKKQKSEAIAEYLFSNNSISETVELTLFHKTEDELKHEFDIDRIELIQRKWKPDYNEKFSLFQNEILSHFKLAAIEDDKWFIYQENHRSDFLIKLDNQDKLSYLDEVVRRTKNKKEYEDYFPGFEIIMDCSYILKKAADLISFFDSNDFENKVILLDELNLLSKKIGVEERLDEIEKEIELIFPNYKQRNNYQEIQNFESSLKLDKKINEIFNLIDSTVKKDNVKLDLKDDTSIINLRTNPKKIIYQMSDMHDAQSHELEFVGASGEIQILGYYINLFLKLSREERIKGIEEVYYVIRTKLNNDSLKEYKEICLSQIDNPDELRKALIPLFYVTMHYKYSYFDLIAYVNGKPTLIEVKTTESKNNNRFYLSIAEVEAALSNENYEIVRVSSDRIHFIGNPIKLVEDKLTEISGTNFSLKPRNFEFTFNN